ncbi:MAG TPA: hypothetical protein VI603_05900, partial [Saprospiraceae bacterium]|nr:hypothetical protein [Saprospiraceae bacterium]
MQDNKNEIDRGWQRMSMLLDKELPQVRRPKRIAAWWLIAAGILLVLSGWGYHFLQSGRDKSDSEMSQPVPDEVELAISSQTEMIPGLSDATSFTDKNSPEGSKQLEASKGVVTRQMTQKSSDEMIFKKEAIRDASSHDERNAESTNEIADGFFHASAQQFTTDSAPIAEVSDAVFTSEEDIAEKEVINLAETESSFRDQAQIRTEIALVRLQPLTPGSLDQRSRNFIGPTTRPQRNHVFGLEALVATHLNSDGNPFYGVEAGLNTIVFSNRRLRVHAGITYGYYNIDGLGLGIFNLAADTEDFENIGGNPDTNYAGFPLYDVKDIVDGALEYREAKQLTEKFHYLHVPLRVEYRITPGFSVMAGMKVSALIAAPARYGLNDARFSSQAQLTSGSRSFLYNYDILRKLDIAPV